MSKSSRLAFATLVLLTVLLIGVWGAVLSSSKGNVLSVSFLNVGQGDSIFIEAPGGTQVLIDAGGNRAVLRELSRVMSWFDRSIDIALATHPDQDHIGGFPDVLSRYAVSRIVYSSVEDDGSDARAFHKAVSKEVEDGASDMVGVRGQVLDLGGGARLEVLFPDRGVPDIETNTGSLVTRLVYGDTVFLLTGDAPSSIEEYLVRLDGKRLQADVLKAGHHGSRTSSSDVFVRTVNPEFAVISRGCDNRYGHPHKEVLDTFSRFDVAVLDTCSEGTITFVSDGETVVRK